MATKPPTSMVYPKTCESQLFLASRLMDGLLRLGQCRQGLQALVGHLALGSTKKREGGKDVESSPLCSIYIYVERESRIVHRYMNDMTHIFIYVIYARIVHDINRI